MDLSFDISAVEEVELMHRCGICNFTTVYKSNLNAHMKRKHKNHPGPITSTPCKSSTGDLQQNAEIGQGTLMCDQCGRTYKSKFGLRLHVKNIHEQTFKHICEICGKGFNQTTQFRFHCSHHLKIMREKCKCCKKEFSAAGSLQRHLKSCAANNQTTDVKAFKCEECDASFTHKYRLTYHVKGKHQQPAYSCKICGKRFAWRSSLKAHTENGH